MKIKLLGLSAILLTSAMQTANASPEMMGKMMQTPAQQFLARDSELAKMNTLDICLGYATLTDETKKQEYIKELDLRSMLSVKDHENVPKQIVENSMTSCGMYMVKGKPLAEQSRQIRPMTFKAVHVYPENYYVTQSGIVMGSYERKEGVMPPALAVEAPKVQAPPVLHK